MIERLRYHVDDGWQYITITVDNAITSVVDDEYGFRRFGWPANTANPEDIRDDPDFERF